MDNPITILEGCILYDRQSQEKLYRQFYPGLYALCKKFFEEEHDILSALNNGMLNVFQNIKQYDASKGELFSWAYSIVRNAALTYLRNKNNISETVELVADIEFDQQKSPFKTLEWKDIYFYLGKLPAATRAVCTLYYVEGFSIKEIASQLQLKEGTIKWHLNESRTRLKIIFNQIPIR